MKLLTPNQTRFWAGFIQMCPWPWAKSRGCRVCWLFLLPPSCCALVLFWFGFLGHVSGTHPMPLPCNKDMRLLGEMCTPVPRGLAQGPAGDVCEAVSTEKLGGAKNSQVKRKGKRGESETDRRAIKRKNRGEGQRGKKRQSKDQKQRNRERRRE